MLLADGNIASQHDALITTDVTAKWQRGQVSSQQGGHHLVLARPAEGRQPITRLQMALWTVRSGYLAPEGAAPVKVGVWGSIVVPSRWGAE